MRFNSRNSNLFAKGKKEDSFFNESLVAEMGFDKKCFIRVICGANLKVAISTLVSKITRYFFALAIFRQRRNGSRRILRLCLNARAIERR